NSAIESLKINNFSSQDVDQGPYFHQEEHLYTLFQKMTLEFLLKRYENGGKPKKGLNRYVKY
ncbi:MAG TPA: hypothetical protein VIZ62_04715, partial [Nitrososphaeraceae archaeon]